MFRVGVVLFLKIICCKMISYRKQIARPDQTVRSGVFLSSEAQPLGFDMPINDPVTIITL